MATTAAQPIVFLVPGQEQPAATRGAAAAPLPAGLTSGVLKQSVRVGAQRGVGAEVRVAAMPGEDVVVLHIAGGPALTLHPENARDLMLAQQGQIKRTRGAAVLINRDPTRYEFPRNCVGADSRKKRQSVVRPAASWATCCCRRSRWSPASAKAMQPTS